MKESTLEFIHKLLVNDLNQRERSYKNYSSSQYMQIDTAYNHIKAKLFKEYEEAQQALDDFESYMCKT